MKPTISKLPVKLSTGVGIHKPLNDQELEETKSSGYTILTSIINKLKITRVDYPQQYISTLTDVHITELSTLKFANKDFIIDPTRKDIILEVVNLLMQYPYRNVFNFLSNVGTPDELMWDQPPMDEFHSNFEREIVVYTMEQKGVVNFGKCRYCPSKELAVATKQTRSGDEPMTVFVTCVQCRRQWRQ